ncbi:hypothetical protein RINTHM_20 [Richelia intracellularis HM01]|nr:hypothetical protein RINTHM_20 [Richelia intracellularis HM01]
MVCATLKDNFFVPAFNVKTADNNANGDALNKGRGTVASFTVLYLRQVVFVSSRCFNCNKIWCPDFYP